MRSSGERTMYHACMLYLSIYRDSASVVSTRGVSLTLAPIIVSANGATRDWETRNKVYMQILVCWCLIIEILEFTINQKKKRMKKKMAKL